MYDMVREIMQALGLIQPLPVPITSHLLGNMYDTEAGGEILQRSRVKIKLKITDRDVVLDEADYESA